MENWPRIAPSIQSSPCVLKHDSLNFLKQLCKIEPAFVSPAAAGHSALCPGQEGSSSWQGAERTSFKLTPWLPMKSYSTAGWESATPLLKAKPPAHDEAQKVQFNALSMCVVLSGFHVFPPK